MKTILTCVMAFALILGFSGEVSAQDPKAMLTELADGIKPEAFKSKWASKSGDWKSNLASLDPTNMDGIMDSFKDLTKNLKSKAFEKGAYKELLASLAGDGAKNIGSSMASLLSGLKPEMLTDGFKENLDKTLKSLKGNAS